MLGLFYIIDCMIISEIKHTDKDFGYLERDDGKLLYEVHKDVIEYIKKLEEQLKYYKG